MTKTVAILLVNYLNYDDTIHCSINYLKQKDVNLKLIVVDNNSPNDSYEKLVEFSKEKEKITIIKSDKNGGYSYGLNFAMKYVEPDNEIQYVVISNTDVEIDNEYLLRDLCMRYEKLNNPGFIAPLVKINNEIFHRSAFDIPSFKYYCIDTSKILRNIGFFKRKYIDTIEEILNRNNKSVIPVDCVAGSLFLGTPKLIKEIEGFDQNLFLFGEEAVMGYKIRDAGRQNYLIIDLKYRHNKSSTISNLYDSYKIDILKQSSRRYIIRKYMRKNRVKLLIFHAFIKFRKIEHIISNILNLKD